MRRRLYNYNFTCKPCLLCCPLSPTELTPHPPRIPIAAKKHPSESQPHSEFYFPKVVKIYEAPARGGGPPARRTRGQPGWQAQRLTPNVSRGPTAQRLTRGEKKGSGQRPAAPSRQPIAGRAILGRFGRPLCPADSNVHLSSYTTAQT